MSESEYQLNGHPRTRGARSSFREDANLCAYPLSFGSVKSFDGTPIFYCAEGEGPPLIFCYGIACSSLHWTYQIDELRKYYRCIYFDYRGHRNTPLPEDLNTLSLESSVKDMTAVLDFLDVKKAVILGHSMGVNVALEFAHAHPERVLGLVLANGTPKKPLDTLLGPGYMAPAFKALSYFQREKPDWVNAAWKVQEKTKVIGDALGRLGFNTALTEPGDIRTYARQIAELPPAVLTRMMENYQHSDSTPWLHEIKTPALILSGDKDIVTPPKTQKLMAQLMPNSELVNVRHGSHCSTLDLPEYVGLLIEKFLRQINYLGKGQK
jgi:pimeloyl-ACP methyl ester carboxylesterase